MAASFGDVVLVPFPSMDQLGAKKRPAVIISSKAYNANRRDLVIMAIASQVRTPLGFGEALAPIGNRQDDEVVVMVYTERRKGPHVIPLRRAEKYEARYYRQVAKENLG